MAEKWICLNSCGGECCVVRVPMKENESRFKNKACLCYDDFQSDWVRSDEQNTVTHKFHRPSAAASQITINITT